MKNASQKEVQHASPQVCHQVDILSGKSTHQVEILLGKSTHSSCETYLYFEYRILAKFMSLSIVSVYLWPVAHLMKEAS